MWADTVTASWQSNTSFPLWYSATVFDIICCHGRCRYSSDDGQQNFDDFVPFGGWTQPYMKVPIPMVCK